MKTIHKRGSGRWVIVGGVLVTAALALLTLLMCMDTKSAKPRLSRIEQEALARFAGSEPYVTLPDGRRLPPSNAAHALQMKVKAFQGILAKEAEQRDPSFRPRVEAELARRRPMRVTIEWTDVTGNREMDFIVEDSSTCVLDEKTEITVAVEDIARYPCFTRGGVFWEAGTQLNVHLIPISHDDAIWSELLYATEKAMAAEAHFARREGPT